MARIRTIKPDFWDSKDTASASLRVRLLYIAMWNWADDYGIGDGNPGRIITFAFPNDDIPASEYPRLLSDVSRAFGVVFFDYRGRPYYAIPAWESHQRTEKKARARDGLIEAAQDAIAADQRQESDNPRTSSDDPALGGGSPVAGTGERGKEERGNRGTGEDDDPLPPEPPPAPYDEAVEAVVVDEPRRVDNPSKPAKRYPSSGAQSVVRQELGTAGYPGTILNRLAIQVENLHREGHANTLIREALSEWDRRPKAIPEWLPTVLGDVVKQSRSKPDVNAADAKVNDWLALAADQQPATPHLRAINE